MLQLPEPMLLGHGLVLRPWAADDDDATALALAWADPEVRRWCGVPDSAGVDDALRWIRGDDARRQAGRSIDLVVAAEEMPSVVLGEVGLVVVGDPSRRRVEIGFWMAPTARRHGHAGRAVELLADWALGPADFDQVLARSHPDNEAAAGVLEQAGFRRIGTINDGQVAWRRVSDLWSEPA